MTKRTPDAEVSVERFIDTYQPKSCLVQTPVLMENMLNTSGPKETSM